MHHPTHVEHIYMHTHLGDAERDRQADRHACVHAHAHSHTKNELIERCDT